MMQATARLLLVASIVATANADILFDNEEVVVEEVFDLKYALDSDVGLGMPNATKYYCVFRGTWNKDDHPNDYPELARFDPPLMFSHTKAYTPFLKNREANQGVEVIAEVRYNVWGSFCTHKRKLQEGFTSTFKDMIRSAGNEVHDYEETQGFYLKKKQEKNFAYLPPLTVTSKHTFISGMAGIDPSPDWFTGFYLFDTIDPYSRKFWSEFKIHSYPWDAGTDAGETYLSNDYELERQEGVRRFTPENAPNGVFVSPLGDEVLPTAEWQCILHSCPIENPDCVKEDWPPSNGCDILKFPECNSACDPKADSICEQCKRQSNSDPKELYFPNCCMAGYDPKKGPACDGSGVREVVGATSLVLSLAVMLV